MKKFFLSLVILLVVLIVGGGLYVYLNKDKIVAKSVEKGFEAIETMMVSNLPESISEENVKVVVSNTIDKVQSGEIAPEELQGVFMKFRSQFEDKQLDSTEVKELMGKMQQLLDKHSQ